MSKKEVLITAGVMDTLISLLHIIFAFRPELYGMISADQESGLSQLASQGSGITTLISVILAGIFAIWAVYCFSGAGLIRKLPALRTVLIIVGVIYILRALFLPSEISMVINQNYPLRFVLFSLISLVAGILHLIGVPRKRSD